MRKWLLMGLLFSATAVWSQSPPENSIPVDTVIITGNKHTRNQVILREIPFRLPATLTRHHLELVQKRLLNLFLFNKVDVWVDTLAKKNALHIHVAESWYFYPVPLIFINERDWKKLSYGLELIHLNFRGMNEKLFVGGWAGYNPSFFVEYMNPWLGRTSRFILALKLFNNFIENKILPDVTEHHVGISASVGKRLNLNVSLQVTANARWVSLPRSYTRYMASGKNWDFVPRLQLLFLADYRDLYEYPLKGYYLEWKISRTGWNAHQPQFWRLAMDQRFYVPATRFFSIALRSYWIFNRGSLPVYDRIFIGYQERIRGHFHEVFTGQHLNINSIEVRIPVLKFHYFSIGHDPRFAAFTQNLKYGLSLGFFLDNGQVWDQFRKWRWKNAVSGYGFGLHIHLPFVYLVRLEQAWNEHGHSQFIVDVGVAF